MNGPGLAIIIKDQSDGLSGPSQNKVESAESRDGGQPPPKEKRTQLGEKAKVEQKNTRQGSSNVCRVERGFSR
jgi:hypothetical protein